MSEQLEKIKQKRAEEIAQGKNLATRNPMYLVYSVGYFYVENTTEYDQNCSLSNIPTRYIRKNVDDTDDTIEVSFQDDDFCEYEVCRVDEAGNEQTYGEAIKKVPYDMLKAVFFTFEAAEAYIEADRHNLSSPFVYVEYIHHKNRQILDLLGEK